MKKEKEEKMMSERNEKGRKEEKSWFLQLLSCLQEIRLNLGGGGGVTRNKDRQTDVKELMNVNNK